MEKFQNKYRIASARAQWWNYGWNGAYFITICTKNRDCFFGKIVNTRLIAYQAETRLIAFLQSSPMGQLAEKIWCEIPNQFPYCELGDFVVMPNHIHGILIINTSNAKTRLIASQQDPRSIASQLDPRSTADIQKTGGFAGGKNPMINENISRIVRWYKGRCTFEMRKIDVCFGWQSLFHDHIIRNDAEYQRISEYIVNNPFNWKGDKFFLQ